MNIKLNNSIIRDSLWQKIADESKNFELDIDQLKRKRTGSYYTSLELTDAMMEELVNKIISDGKDIWNLKFLEPCVGTGNFVFSYLKQIYNLNLGDRKNFKLINNIYVCDINKEALEKYKQLLYEFVLIYFNIELDEEYFSNHIGKGLLFNISSEKFSYISIKECFNNSVDLFDIVVTNPPYKNLKAERKQYFSDEEYNRDKLIYNTISRYVKNNFLYSVDGVLNLYKVFIEDIICKYTVDNGYISLLIPSSILSDKTCLKLRTYMLCENTVLSVKLIEEKNSYIDAKQAICTLFLKKGGRTGTVNITKDFCNKKNQCISVGINDILNSNTGNAIIALDKQEYDVFQQLKKFPVVKDLPFIFNLRGELDLTTDKSFLTYNNGYPLLRGRNIGYYFVSNSEDNDNVMLKFVDGSQKSIFIHNQRIACQQVVNINKKRRVIFAFVDRNYVLGNSCNFISVVENRYNIDLFVLLGLFNSNIINWYFKLTSSNNHVNNYEIDRFPVPINSKFLNKISICVQQYLKCKDDKLLEKIEGYVNNAYEINLIKEEAIEDVDIIVKEYYNDISQIAPQITLNDAKNLINSEVSVDAIMIKYGIFNKIFDKKVFKGITDKYLKISKGKVLNHITFKLSDLDIEMIKFVPQGGNWKNIPLETVIKSKRLTKITQTGGRTTLYGRIHYDKPSYTITTYFNRPGNGTYVHPIHQRVISVREAARFQTFRDDYYFFGNKTQYLKQIGNAVPTILAYQIAREINKKTGCTKSVDLFCGAGGLTSGFKAAGIKSLLCNDIDENACVTLKINNPEINVLCGDITDVNIKRMIEEISLKGGVDIICGGPPCQGFSMAGFREKNDPRNQLFRDFVDIVKRVNPKVIVFENVEGLLSFQKGDTYRELHRLFSDLGYKTEGRILMASDYAVPQKRKRVFIICTRNDISVLPSDLFPAPITIDSCKQVTARETIEDLQDVKCDENATYIESDESDILKFLKNKISYEEYLDLKIQSVKNDRIRIERFEQLNLL